jgi:hypothetical protein
MIIVGLPYSFAGLTRMDQVTGGTPYGATTLAGPDGSRLPTENELGGHASNAGMLLRSRPGWNAVLVSVVPLRRRCRTLRRPLTGRRIGPESSEHTNRGDPS